MRRRHLALIPAALLACLTVPARAQQVQPPTAPSSVMVDVGGALTWKAKEINWGDRSREIPTAVMRRGEAPIRPGAGGTSASNTVEIIGAADGQVLQWARAAGAAPPKDVTITLFNSARSPVVKYLLRRAVPTKVTVDQMNASASETPMLHVTLTAQSVTIQRPTP